MAALALSGCSSTTPNTLSPEAAPPDAPASDAPTTDAAACPSQPSRAPLTLEQDVANLCANPPPSFDSGPMFYWAVGYSTSACGGFLAVAEHQGVDTLNLCLFDPATHQVVECGTFPGGAGPLECTWSATGYARDLQDCSVEGLPLNGIGWNLTIACSNDSPPPADAGPDAATEASTDGATD